MNVFDQILNEQKDLLQERGYNESAIHSKDPEGKLFRRLENNLSQAIKYADQFKETYEFEIHTEGHFPESEMKVSFTFEYVYDPNSEKLQIKSLVAWWGKYEQEHEYLLLENRFLPCSATLVYRLTEIERDIQKAIKIADFEQGEKGQKL